MDSEKGKESGSERGIELRIEKMKGKKVIYFSFVLTEAGVKIVPIEGSREAKVNEGATTSGYGLHPSRGVNPVIVGEGVQGGSRGRSLGRGGWGGGWRGGWRGWRGGRGGRGRGGSHEREITQVKRKG